VTGGQLEVALVNLMPDAAFEDADRQFVSLVRGGADNLMVDLGRFAIPVEGRRDDVARLIEEHYAPIDALTRWAPDAIVVTGTEPKADNLSEEAVWDDLVTLYRWAEATGCSVYSSCLAAHAAVLALDGVHRRRLPAKLSGVFTQRVRFGHPLTKGVAALRCPHSRLNEVPAEELERCGYEILVGSAEVGWSVAAREAGSLSVLVQGHPEYGPSTLLREYRRDVRRYLEAEQDEYPQIPVGYLSAEAAALLDQFKVAATTERDPSLMAAFPFEACAGKIRDDWTAPMQRMVGNWLHEVARGAGRRVVRAG
jgi:homoserine O-succinyltransferase